MAACATNEKITSTVHTSESQPVPPSVDPCLDKRIMMEGDIEIQGLLNALEEYKPPTNLGYFFRTKRILIDVIEEYKAVLGICYTVNKFNYRVDAVLKRVEELEAMAIRQWMTYIAEEKEKREKSNYMKAKGL